MITPADNSMTNDLAIDARGLDTLKLQASENSPAALKGAAKQFEALFLNMVMKSMRDATPQDGAFDDSQTKMYTSMLDEQISQNLASRGVGLADMLVRQLSPALHPGQASDTAQTGTNASQQTGTDALNAADASTVPSIGSSTDTDMAKGTGLSNQPPHVQAFRERLAAHAEEASRATGIPAKFMLGQAALESGWGKHVIKQPDGTSSHNLFGIKATPDWKGKTVSAVTTEYVHGVPHRKVEKFRAYDSYEDSFRDYANMLRSNPHYQKVLASAGNASQFAQGLQRAGYATDPHYAAKLTQIIDRNLSA